MHSERVCAYKCSTQWSTRGVFGIQIGVFKPLHSTGPPVQSASFYYSFKAIRNRDDVKTLSTYNCYLEI